MSDDAVAVVRRWFAALQQGNPAPELCDPESHGHDGLQRWWDDVAEAFEEFQWALKSVEPIDADRCLTVQRIAGRTVRDGKILSAVGYATPRRARRAAGLE